MLNWSCNITSYIEIFITSNSTVVCWNHRGISLSDFKSDRWPRPNGRWRGDPTGYHERSSIAKLAKSKSKNLEQKMTIIMICGERNNSNNNNNGTITIVMIIIRHLEVSMIITLALVIIGAVLHDNNNDNKTTTSSVPLAENVTKPPKTTTIFTQKPTWSPTVASEVSLTEAPSETFRSKSPKKMNVPPWINGGVSGGPPAT